jgi:hypothetical protein
MMNGLGLSGATAGAAGAGTAAGAAGAAATGAAGAALLIAATALWQAGESFALFLCRHCSAAAPPSRTPGQFLMKSDRQAERIVEVRAAVGLPGAAAAAGALPCAGVLAGATCSLGGVVAVFGGGASSGADAAGAGGAAGAAAAGSAGFAAIALTAALHEADSRLSLRTRHSSASLPPGCTPEQLAMKSDRHELRIAAVCSAVGCCASAE